MSIPSDIRAFFVAPANMGSIQTLPEIAKGIGCDNTKALGVALWSMRQSGELEAVKNDANKWEYRYNPKFVASHKSPGEKTEAPAAPRKARKSKPAKPQKAPKKKRVLPAVKSPPPAVAPVVTRWALTSDGAFVDLLGGQEIEQNRARALVDFIRKMEASRP